MARLRVNQLPTKTGGAESTDYLIAYSDGVTYKITPAQLENLLAGVDGKSAYQVAVDNGFSGTVSDWLDSLVGATGAAGSTGSAGADGADGTDFSYESVSFTGAIDMSSAKVMTPTTVSGALTFTVTGTPSAFKPVYVRLTANGVNTPDFSNFVEWGSSLGWVNIDGTVNSVTFFNDGTENCYSVLQAYAPASGGSGGEEGGEPSPARFSFNQVSGMVESGNSTDGYGYLASAGASVDALVNPDKVNILVCAETANACNTGGFTSNVRTGEQAWTDCSAYIQARKTANPSLKIILCGTTPSNIGGTWDSRVNTFENLAKANYRKIGADRYVNFRTTDSPAFNHVNDLSTFEAYPAYWADAYLHLTTTGKTEMVRQICNQGISKLYR